MVLCAVLAAAILLAAASFAAYGVLEKALLYPLRYTAQVEQWAGEYDVDPYLVYAVIRTESSFDPAAVSSAGARGLMQMTKDTFDWIKTKIAADEPLTYDDLFEPEQSIRFGTYFLAISLQRYGGDVATAAAAYHSGWGTVDRLLAAGEHTEDGVTLSGFPHRQMSHYVHKVTTNYKRYSRLYGEG